VPAAFNGARGFHSILLARADSGIRTPADAGGKTLALSAGDSIAGRLVPLKYLARDGIDMTRHFAAVVEATDPAAAIAALQAGTADLAVGWSSLTGNPATGYDFGVLTGLVQARKLSMDSVRVVWQSPLIPFGPHAVRSDLPDDLTALDAVDRSPNGGGGFTAIAASDYAVVADLIGVSDVEGLNGLTPLTPALPPPGAPGPITTPGSTTPGPVPVRP
jgi:phosphonate transport system substrate-binding protein